MLGLVLALGLMGCSKGTDDPQPPKPPQPTETGLSGSLAGKDTRWSKGHTFTGKTVTEWNDTVWKTERVNQQIILWTEKDAVENLEYVVSDISNGSAVIPKENVRIRFIDYILGDAQAYGENVPARAQDVWIGDALSETTVTKVTPADPLKIWISVDVPKETPSGSYSGKLSVNQGETNLVNLGINLVVTNHTLPDVKDWNFHLDIWQFPFQLAGLCSVEPFSSSYYQQIKPFYQLRADAGQKSITTYIKDGAFVRGNTMVDWSLSKDGMWKFNYSKFDSFVEFMMGLGIDKQINCFSLAGWSKTIGYTDEATGKYVYKSFDIGESEYNVIWETFLSDFQTHLVSKGWFSKTVLYMDEIAEKEMEKIVNLILQCNPDWKIGLAGHGINASLERKFYDYCTIIGYDRKATNNIVATFYTSCSQKHPNNFVTLETEPAEMTWMPWHALAKGFGGYARWAFDYWTLNDPKDARDGSNSAGDFHMIYRTGNTATAKPVSSIRFELLREGVQDYEKVSILGKTKVRDILSDFNDVTAPSVKANVLNAQRYIKKISVN